MERKIIKHKAVKTKRNVVEWAMHYRQIVILVVTVLVAFGIWSLNDINKNEFPDFTIRQGVVMAVYPGADAHQMEEEVTKPLENYIFTYKEVRKAKTKSYSRNGVSIIQVELNEDVYGAAKDNFWSRLKLGLQQYKASLPQGVVAIQVQDDFGDASALLITMESEEKTYRELNDYMDDLKDRLRRIESVGRLNVYGMQREQITVEVNTEKLSQYGIGQNLLATALAAKGFSSMAGTQKTLTYEAPIHVARSLNMVNDVEQQIVYSSPDGKVVRVKDIATVKREYPKPTSFVTNNGKKSLVLSLEIKKNRSITDMGREISQTLQDFQQTLPKEVTMTTITDLSQVVSKSVSDFLTELLIAIIAVIIVVILLLPLRVALVAASTIPITIFISLGLFHVFGMELNTVTLAALIVTLGLIVDDSIVIIDNYVDNLAEGMSRWRASVMSATHFFKSIFTATLAISITFFPFLFTMTGMYHDFMEMFPWTMTIVLLVSLAMAELVVPFLQFYFIRKPLQQKLKSNGKPAFSFLNMVQGFYNRLIERCFRHPYITVGIGFLAILLGVAMMILVPQKIMPTADRDQLAVEIYLPAGTSLERTTAVADSLEHIMRKDKRILSIASFKGTSSPRFQTTYAPQFGGKNYAQFIVNTLNARATEDVLHDYRMRYADAFPNAYVRFRQLSYSTEDNAVEIRLSGDDWHQLRHAADSLTGILRRDPALLLVRHNASERELSNEIKVDELQAGRVGASNASVSWALATRYLDGGLPVAHIWNGDYDIPVKLTTTKSALSSANDLANEPIPVAGGFKTVPLRQIAKVEPIWKDAQVPHRNGVPTITIMADVANGKNVLHETSRIKKEIKAELMPKGVNLEWGGEDEMTRETLPQIIGGLLVSVAIIFFLLLGHFHKVSTSVLLLFSLPMILFGASLGVIFAGVDFSFTCYMGVVSLMGILVRNSIIMYDYAEELRNREGLTAHEAIFLSAKRRMRPIFLTSAAASVGVVPMMLGGTSLWGPMGNVIFIGTLVTMVLILTVLPVAYWLLMSGTTSRRKRSLMLEKE
ncbi:MAG: efflux RND transporter permease subunit [Prevotella sp.]|jgi:multidrug efflux pump subunit AcrB